MVTYIPPKTRNIKYLLGRPYSKFLKKLRRHLGGNRQLCGIPITALRTSDLRPQDVLDIKLVSGNHSIRVRMMGYDAYSIGVQQCSTENWYRVGQGRGVIPSESTPICPDESYASMGNLETAKVGYQSLEAAIIGIDSSNDVEVIKKHFRNLCLMLSEAIRITEIGETVSELIGSFTNLDQIPQSWPDIIRAWSNSTKTLAISLPVGIWDNFVAAPETHWALDGIDSVSEGEDADGNGVEGQLLSLLVGSTVDEIHKGNSKKSSWKKAKKK